MCTHTYMHTNACTNTTICLKHSQKKKNIATATRICESSISEQGNSLRWGVNPNTTFLLGRIFNFFFFFFFTENESLRSQNRGSNYREIDKSSGFWQFSGKGKQKLKFKDVKAVSIRGNKIFQRREVLTSSRKIIPSSVPLHSTSEG